LNSNRKTLGLESFATAKQKTSGLYYKIFMTILRKSVL
jgi:hypothetical protein